VSGGPRRSLLLPLLLGAVTAACGHAPFRCERRGGPAWRELRTPGFVLHTDLPAPEARAFAAELERLDVAVRGGLARDLLPADVVIAERPPRLEVVVFAVEGQFRTFAREQVQAFHVLSELGGERIVLPAELEMSARATLAHELTHRWLARALNLQPLWLAEGAAVYMESLGAQDGLFTRGVATLGGMPPDRWVQPPTAAQLYRVLDRSGSLFPEEYALAWAVVHFLQNTHRAEFQDLLRRLARGEPVDAAWRAALPGRDFRKPAELEALHRELVAYLGGGRYTFREVQLPTATPPVEEAPFPSDRVHAIRLDLPRISGPRVRKVLLAIEREADEALAETPGHLAALQALAWLRPGQAEALAQQAVAARPDDPDAIVFLARSLPGARTAEREALYARALAAAPDHVAALWLRAEALVELGRPEEALPFAQRAARLSRWGIRPHLALGDAFAGSHRCTEALNAYWRALDLATAGGAAELATVAKKRILPIQKQCPEAFAPAAPAPPAPAPGG